MQLTRRQAATIATTLDTIHELLPHAEARAAGQLRLTTGGRATGYGARTPINMTALANLDEARALIITALTDLTLADQPAPTARAAVHAARHHPGGITRQAARHPRAADLHADLQAAARILERLCDRPPETLYVGLCDNLPGGRPCNTGIYARPHAVTATCTHCGHTVDVRERRQYLIDRAHRMALPARTIADALTTPEFGHINVTVKDIHNWAARGHITVKGTNSLGHRLYNLGDVLRHALARHA